MRLIICARRSLGAFHSSGLRQYALRDKHAQIKRSNYLNDYAPSSQTTVTHRSLSIVELADHRSHDRYAGVSHFNSRERLGTARRTLGLLRAATVAGRTPRSKGPEYHTVHGPETSKRNGRTD